MKYVAFLRGINVGGNKQVKMEVLRHTFETLGFHTVKTLLNSGNVLFETSETNIRLLTQNIEESLKKTCGWEVPVLLRTSTQIQTLLQTNPFSQVTITPETRLYVTFLSEKPTSRLPIPYETPEKDFKILSINNEQVCSVLTLSPKRGTVDVMKIIEKEFGKKVTTRSWNIIHKLFPYE